jgi:hypothetical protein
MLNVISLLNIKTWNIMTAYQEQETLVFVLRLMIMTQIKDGLIAQVRPKLFYNLV